MQRLAEISKKNLEAQSNLEVINFLMTFQSCRLNDAKILETFVARLVNVREDLEDDELNKIITTLSDLGYVN